MRDRAAVRDLGEMHLFRALPLISVAVTANPSRAYSRASRPEPHPASKTLRTPWARNTATSRRATDVGSAP
jgi:hypothetical protein